MVKYESNGILTTKPVMSMQIPSAFSLASSLIILLSWYLFPDLRRLRYVELVAWIAINNFFSSLGTVLGHTANGSPGCWFQGIITNVCPLAEGMFMTLIAWQLYQVTINNKIIQDIRPYIFWNMFISCVISVLPLSTNTYENPSPDEAWCYISEGDDELTYVMWTFFAFYFWIIIFAALQIYLLLEVGLHLRNIKGSTGGGITVNMWYSLVKLTPYPIIYIISWTIDGVVDLSSDQTPAMIAAGNVTSCLVGFWCSLIFFYTNSIVRERWYLLCLKWAQYAKVEAFYLALFYKSDAVEEIERKREEDGGDQRHGQGSSDKIPPADHSKSQVERRSSLKDGTIISASLTGQFSFEDENKRESRELSIHLHSETAATKAENTPVPQSVDLRESSDSARMSDVRLDSQSTAASFAPHRSSSQWSSLANTFKRKRRLSVSDQVDYISDDMLRDQGTITSNLKAMFSRLSNTSHTSLDIGRHSERLSSTSRRPSLLRNASDPPRTSFRTSTSILHSVSETEVDVGGIVMGNIVHNLDTVEEASERSLSVARTRSDDSSGSSWLGVSVPRDSRDSFA